MSGPGVDGTEVEWAAGRSRRLEMAQYREPSVSPWELLGPCRSLTRGEPSLQVAGLSPLFIQGACAWNYSQGTVSPGLGRHS